MEGIILIIIILLFLVILAKSKSSNFSNTINPTNPLNKTTPSNLSAKVSEVNKSNIPTPSNRNNLPSLSTNTSFATSNSVVEEKIKSNFKPIIETDKNDSNYLKENHSTEFTIHVETSITESHYKRKTNNCRWIKNDETVIIQGYKINSGLIYVGEWICSENNSFSCDPCLINPRLPVNKLYVDTDLNLGYWPSYSDLIPKERGAYLNWLATGRNDPAIQIGFVFLFFYGLERRLLIDLVDETDENQIERNIILSELRRLLKVYNNNNSFINYASNLFTYGTLIYKKDTNILQDVENVNYGEYPIYFKLQLANSASNHLPLPSAIALKWVEYNPFTYLRTPFKRCRKEFEKLFEIKYQKKFGEGVYLKPNKSPLIIDYKPANSLNKIFKRRFSEIPDLTKLTRYSEKFWTIAQECEDELDQYSRYIGRKPDEVNSFSALSYLPNELFHSKDLEVIEKIKVKLRSEIEINKNPFVNISWLLELMGKNSNVRLTKNDVIGIIQFLSKIDIGIEPDVRFCGQLLKVEDKAVLFYISDEFPSAPSKEYSATLTLITYAIFISVADGDFSKEERDFIIHHVEASLKLSKVDLVRISAYADWLSTVANQIKGISKKIKNLSHDSKLQIIRFLLTLANADGYISPEEIKSLKKIYKIFDIDEEKIYSDIHAIQTTSSDLATIIPGCAYEYGFSIPKEKINDTINLDEALIEKTLRDTYKVKDILIDIFEEEDSVIDVSSSVATEKYVLGLDQTHTALLNKIIQKERWERSEYEFICYELNLLADGAIETLNEVFFGKYGVDLIIIDDDLEINVSVLTAELKYTTTFNKK